MAALPIRSRDQPDIRARISTCDESPDDIKSQLQIADRTQRSLRQQHPWTAADGSGPSNSYRGVLRKSQTVVPHRPGHFSSDALPCPLPLPLQRSNSFNSLSTLHREAEAAALTVFRDSPISAISPPCVGPTLRPLSEVELEDPCPPRPIGPTFTLNQQRKYQKLLKKSFKKQEREQRRAQKEDEALRRAFLAAEVKASREKDALTRGETLPTPSRSSMSTKTIASQVVKSLSFKSPLGKISRHMKKDKPEGPSLDDFDSKEEIRQYLNPSRTSTESAIAELPANLPPYTPFQNSTRTENNAPVSVSGDLQLEEPKRDGPAGSGNALGALTVDGAKKSMRCDSCQTPIRLNQVYYHCSVCENGDRILCAACDLAGSSCRHIITEKTRKVTREEPAKQLSSSTVDSARKRGSSEAQQYAAAMWGLSIPNMVSASDQLTESPQQATMSASSPWAYHDILERAASNRIKENEVSRSQKLVEEKELELRRREQDLVLREREMSLRQSECVMREKQASFREQEAAFNIRQQLFFQQQQQWAMTQQMRESASGIGAQFPELAADDSHVRNHGTKRKAASGQTGISPSNSTGSSHKPSSKRSPGGGQDPTDDDEEEAGSGTPKKMKQDPDSPATPDKLFACQFCKFDKAKYSEQNRLEKHYRGCSSGYWPDISRLKQHLYRVHWRRHYCTRCYEKFESKHDLDEHLRSETLCPVQECPYPEKFDEDQYNEIRRKRPGKTPEQVWYTIYNILFPNSPPPATPYADQVEKPAASVSSPTPQVECQDTMAALGELFETRLNQHSGAGHTWLQSPEAREFIRQQLRASMADVLQRMKPNSPSLGQPSVDVSPSSAVAPSLARHSSFSVTPNSSLPVSPIDGPSMTAQPATDGQWLLPAHRQSFSRPFPSRRAQNTSTSAPSTAHQAAQVTPAYGSQHSNIIFPIITSFDPENDHYDEECNSWNYGDERGLAISTDFNFDFHPTLASAVGDLNNFHPAVHPDVPVNQLPLPESVTIAQQKVPPTPSTRTQLKPKHSTASSVDSGYGSLSHASSLSSHRPSSSSSHQNASRRTARAPDKQKQREPSPVPEADINFDALAVSFQDFSGNGLDLSMDEFGLVDSGALSAGLQGQFPEVGQEYDSSWVGNFPR